MKTKFIFCLSTSLTEANIPDSGNHVLVAVSGGEDSMCLLHGLIQINQEFDLNISVMHVNHGLRITAMEDQRLVEKYSLKYNLPFYVQSLSEVPRTKNENIESWARFHRYTALQNKSKEINAHWILTAHHGNDQIETLLQRIVEGAGSRGLIGIHKRNGSILRPLLLCSKKDIHQYQIENNIPFVYDLSNDDTSFTRNYIRNKVVPMLDKRFDQIVRGVDRTSQSMGEVEEVINYALNNLETNPKIKKSKNRWCIPLDLIQNVPLLLQVRFLQKTCDMQAPLRTHEWNELKHFLVNSKTGNTVKMCDWKILRNRNELIIEKVKEVKDEIEWNIDNSIQFQGYQLTGRIHDVIPKMNDNPRNEFVDAEKLESKSLWVRNWNKGDRFIPLGMKSNKKVSDFLTDKKIDVFSKQRQFVLTADDDIVWVCGQRISDTYKVTPFTNRVMELTMIQK